MTMMQSKIAKFILFIFICLCCAGFAYAYIQYQSIYPSTDNAYLQAHVIKVRAEVRGKISKIYVKDYQQIKKDDLILQIDPAPFVIAKDKAKYNLELAKQRLILIKSEIDIAKAKLNQYEVDMLNTERYLKRLQSLLASRAISQVDFEEKQTKYNIAVNQVLIGKYNLQDSENKYNNALLQIKTAQEELNQAALTLQYTTIKAPANGVIMNFTQRVGDYITVGQSILSLIESNEWWVDANFKETQIANIKPGNIAKIELDIYPNQPFQGIVEAISDGSGAVFSLLPPENAVGNWIKITQRFTVKINIPNDQLIPILRMGASCQVTIDTRKHHQKK